MKKHTMLRYTYLTLIVGATALTLHAQPAMQLWDFDGSDQAFAAVMRNTDQPTVAEGIKAFGVYLDGQGTHFEPEALPASTDFTYSFWVNLTTTFTPRTLLLHQQGNSVFHAQVAAGRLALALDGQPLNLAQAVLLSPGEWHYWAYVRQGSRITYYLDGQPVYQGIWMASAGTQRLAVGAAHQSAKSLEGILDEVSLQRAARPQSDITAAIEAVRPSSKTAEEVPEAPPVSRVSQPLANAPAKPAPAPQVAAKAAPKAAPRQMNTKWKGKRNTLALEVPVMSSTVALRYWNDETYYDEYASFQLNSDTATFERQLIPRSGRRAVELPLNLDRDALNYLTIAAEDMSIYDQQNKLKFQLVVDGVAFEDVYEVTMTRYQNAVIAINHIPLNPDKPTIVPIASTGAQRYKVVVENTILDPVVLPTQQFTVTLTNRADAPRELALTLNASKVTQTIRLEAGATQTLNLAMRTPDQDVLILEAMYLQDAESFPLDFTLSNDEGVTLLTRSTDLSTVNNLLPLAYVPPAVAKRADNEKYIIVDTEEITLQVRDFSKVDGDIVTILLNGTPILENYTLTSDYRDVSVKLSKDDLNRLTFIPVSMGRSKGENTAYVMVRAKGKVIHEFSLRSLDVNKPARIYIQYAGE